MLYAAAEYIVLFGAMYQCHMYFHLADQAVTERLCTSGTTCSSKYHLLASQTRCISEHFKINTDGFTTAAHGTDYLITQGSNQETAPTNHHRKP